MIHVFPISYRGKILSVLSYRNEDGTREIISIGGWDVKDIPPMMLAKAHAQIKRMLEYSPPQNKTSWN